jgi:CRISPR/Cas system-associated exonuclease Cas4 (RecB family)
MVFNKEIYKQMKWMKDEITYEELESLHSELTLLLSLAQPAEERQISCCRECQYSDYCLFGGGTCNLIVTNFS